VSILDILQPIYSALPEITPPEKRVDLSTKLKWTAVALILFYVLGNITVIGLSSTAASGLGQIQTLLASDIGTLISAGIGPIVLASIVLQLLVGGKILNIDLTNPKDRARFQGLQKLFAIILCFFEAGVLVVSGVLLPVPGFLIPMILQVALGSLILLYLDEIVSKYGLGSGIGLFIAAGVSESFFWQIFRPAIFSEANPALASGGILATFLATLSSGANLILFIPILVAIVIFLIIVFAEGMHVNIPITMGRTGAISRYPVKLMYVSNMPVILAIALFANIQLWSRITENIPFLGGIMSGVAWATNSPFNLFNDIIVRIAAEGLGPALTLLFPQILQGVVYLIILVACCIVFGIFWVQMGGQSPEAVANQLQSSGMYIPGFRRDKRIIEKILNRYIPTITILGSIFVGLLAGLGDMALGAVSSGTGILLTVGIVYRIYEEVAKEQAIAQYPFLSRFLG
jgi:preprotein translocase subunit SecY